jgi:polysaccharide biosynthesis/export protein
MRGVNFCPDESSDNMCKARTVSILSAILFMLVSDGLGHSTPGGLSSASADQISDASHPPPEVLVSSGDLLTVGVDGAPEYRCEVRVSSAGNASLPMIGNIKLAGLSTSQAENVVARSLQERGFFNDPQVSVFVKEYATQGISVLGEVQRPGIYPLLGRRTLLDAISAAGGTTPKAGSSVTITDRDRPESSKTVKLSYAEGQTMSTMMVHPGDTVVVSKAGMVYVVGDVKEPTGIVMESPHLTVLQAIAMAHGTNPTASLKSVKLIRKGNSAPQEIAIPLNMILAAKEPDLLLQPDDIVFVPNSTAKTATRRGLEAMLQAATGVAIYGRY